MRWTCALIGVSVCVNALAQSAFPDASRIATLPTPAAATDTLVSAVGTVAALCEGGKVLVWSVADGKLLREFDRGENAANLLAISDDGQYVLVSEKGGGTFVLDVRSGATRFETHLKHKVMVGAAYVSSSAAAISHDNSRIAIAAIGEAAQVFGLESGRRLYSLTPTPGGTNAIAFSRNGRLIASADTDGVVRIYAASDGRLVAKNEDSLNELFAIDFSADGKEVIAAGGDGVTFYIDAGSGRAVRRSTAAADPVVAIAVSPDGTRVAAALMQATLNLGPAPIYVSDVRSGESVHSWMPNAPLRGTAWTSRGHLLATTVTPQAVEVWSLR